LDRPEREGIRWSRRDHAHRWHGDRRRDRRRRRAPPRRPALRPRRLHPQIPPAGRAGARSGRDRALHRSGRTPARADPGRGGPALDRRQARRAGHGAGAEGTVLAMLYAQTSPSEKRRAFRERLSSGELLRFPGAFNPLSARLIERKGFDGVYISGAVLSADLGLPDIGLTTLTEVAGRGQQIARMTELPAIIDADTGFGEPMNVARTIQTLEDSGLAGMHIEDQINPKRCGHPDGKAVVDEQTAIKRIRAAVDARRDPNFLIMARTDIAAVDGLDAAIDR